MTIWRRVSESEEPTMTSHRLLARMRERRADRRQKRAWRRERRKTNVNAYDAVNKAESSNYEKGGFFTK